MALPNRREANGALDGSTCPRWDSLLRFAVPKNVKYQAKRVIFHPGQVPLSNALFIDGEALFNSLANHAKLESAVSIFSKVPIGPRL